MGIADAFLRDILAHPDDDAPRLIYADWLDERNDPRGEFIRVQCTLAHLGAEDARRWPLEQRQQELLREHRTKWLPEDIGNALCRFRRGFVEEIEFALEDFPDRADSLFEQAPIRRLHLHRRGRVSLDLPNSILAQIASSPHLTRIHALSLTDLQLSRRELHEFLAAPTLRHLTELRLSRLGEENEGRPLLGPNGPATDIVSDLTRLPCRDTLTSLHLANTGLTLDALRVLAASPSLVRLRELNLSDNRLSHGVIAVLADGRLSSRLETLQLDFNLLGDGGALAMCDWPVLPRLTRLSLGHNHIFSAGVQALAEAPALADLITLDLFGNISCDAGTAALAGRAWTRLQALNLRFNGVGDLGTSALAHSQTLAQLTRLDLTANRITSWGARSLIDAPGLSCLARLDLPRNDIGSAEHQGLRERFGPFVFC